MAKFFATAGNGKLVHDFTAIVDSGAKVRDLTTNKLTYDDMSIVSVRFDRGILVTEDELVIEFCRKYNSGGKLSTGRYLQPTDFPKITETAPGSENVKVETKIVEKVVEKSVVPKAVLNSMEFEAIVTMAKESFETELEAKDKKEAIKELVKLGFVK